MFEFIERWFRRRQHPKTRLDEVRVVDIAREAAAGQAASRDRLTLVTLGQRGGRITWFVSEAVIGSALVVSIDDESGEVVEIGRHHGR